MPAQIEIWISGDFGSEDVVWYQDEIPFSMDRFHYDQQYADVISKHMERAVEYIAKELGELALATPPPDF